MMARRSGSVDPGLLLYLLRHGDMELADLDRGLNEDSGLLGVSGAYSDWRALNNSASAGNDRAQLAKAMFMHRLVAAVGGMVATLGGLDALVFTGGIGEHSPDVSQRLRLDLSSRGCTWPRRRRRLREIETWRRPTLRCGCWLLRRAKT